MASWHATAGQKYDLIGQEARQYLYLILGYFIQIHRQVLEPQLSFSPMLIEFDHKFSSHAGFHMVLLGCLINLDFQIEYSQIWVYTGLFKANKNQTGCEY